MNATQDLMSQGTKNMATITPQHQGHDKLRARSIKVYVTKYTKPYTTVHKNAYHKCCPWLNTPSMSQHCTIDKYTNVIQPKLAKALEANIAYWVFDKHLE